MVAATTALSRRETPAEVMNRRFQSASDRLGLNGDIRALLARPCREIHAELPVRMDDGIMRIFTAFRVQHCDVRGPYKGGLRLHPSVEIEDLRAFASAMTWKSALLNLPFGGAKSGIACDPATMSERELESLTRRYTGSMHLFMGPYRDIHAPELNTDARTMAWMLDEYSHVHEYTPACLTGKPVELGGSPAYEGANGRGVAVLVRETAADLGLEQNGLRVAVQGSGATVARTALLLARAGCLVVALSDCTSAIHNDDGIDIDALIAHCSLAGSIKGFSGAGSVDHAEFLESDCDVLIAAGPELQLNGRTAGTVKAQIIVESTVLASTTDADAVFRRKGITVVPDLLGSSGNLIVSYMEWNQNLQQVFREEERVNEDLEQTLLRGYRALKERSENDGTTLREAAYDIAIERVARAEMLRKV